MLKLISEFWRLYILEINKSLYRMNNPVIAAAGVAAAAQLIGGLFSNAAQAEERKRQRIYEATQQGFESQKQANAQLAQGQAQGMDSLIKSYRDALL